MLWDFKVLKSPPLCKQRLHTQKISASGLILLIQSDGHTLPLDVRQYNRVCADTRLHPGVPWEMVITHDCPIRTPWQLLGGVRMRAKECT